VFVSRVHARSSSAFDVPTTPLRRPELRPLASGSSPISSPNSEKTPPTSSVCNSTVVNRPAASSRTNSGSVFSSGAYERSPASQRSKASSFEICVPSGIPPS